MVLPDRVTNLGLGWLCCPSRANRPLCQWKWPDDQFKTLIKHKLKPKDSHHLNKHRAPVLLLPQLFRRSDYLVLQCMHSRATVIKNTTQWTVRLPSTFYIFVAWTFLIRWHLWTFCSIFYFSWTQDGWVGSANATSGPCHLRQSLRLFAAKPKRSQSGAFKKVGKQESSIFPLIGLSKKIFQVGKKTFESNFFFPKISGFREKVLRVQSGKPQIVCLPARLILR